MAKKKKETVEKPEEAATQKQEPAMQILAQYIKDASFENPNAPNSLRSDQVAPQIGINIEIGRQMMDDDTVEVVLMLTAKAERDGKLVFLCELEYAGLFGFSNVPEEHLQPMILIECPRMLFPFARQIMAEMTQNGGYPPILLDPPDFSAMFREEMMRRAQEDGGSAAVN
ncbi:MAG: protein-export chaperone SecB [Robiginitomaculum sp.]